jgi:hypothetical protein
VVTFPEDFDGGIAVDIATSETVGYYGAHIAETMRNYCPTRGTVYLDSRHVIQVGSKSNFICFSHSTKCTALWHTESAKTCVMAEFDNVKFPNSKVTQI